MMTLAHLIPELDKLSRAEKLHVIQHLAHEALHRLLEKEK